MKRFFGLAAASLLLAAGCASPQLGRVNPIPIARMNEVVAEIKRQVSIYHGRINTFQRDPTLDKALENARRQGFVCGKGSIDFELVSVTMKLTTTTGNSASAGVGVGAGPATFGIGGSYSVENSQELNMPLYVPLPKREFTYVDSGKDAPIADTLLSLREALIWGATSPGSCMVTYDFRDKDHDPGGSYTLGITVSATAKGGVEIALAPLSASVGVEASSATGNTLTVAFRQAGVFKDPKLNGKGVGEGEGGIGIFSTPPTVPSQ